MVKFCVITYNLYTLKFVKYVNDKIYLNISRVKFTTTLKTKQKIFPNVCVNNKYHTNDKQQNKLQNGT